MKVNKEILEFSDFLNRNFEDIYKLSQKIESEKKNIILADKIENGYLQFIWEIMVESLLCKNSDFLEPYGDGADFNGTSSRVTSLESFANKKISIYIKNSVDLLSKQLIVNQNFDFIKLVKFDGNYYSQNTPFNFALCDDDFGIKYLFKINEIDFILENIEDCKPTGD